MPRNEPPQIASLPLGATALAVVSFGVAGLAATATSEISADAHAPLAATVALTVAATVVVGGLLLLPLLLRLRTLEQSLAWLARGMVATSPSRTRGWPLSAIFARLAELSRRVSDDERRERQAAAFREQLLRQTAEAATREERNRLARELHDSIKQQLFSISVSAAAARARSESAGSTTDPLGDIQRSAHEAQVEMRALLQQLRPAPLESVGLVEALRDQCEAVRYRTGAAVTVDIGELSSDELLPPGTQEAIFRIAQEALANVARHARAHTVSLDLRRAGMTMLLEVRDDGQGFEIASARGGMGLGNVRERARALGGSAEIVSAPGAGTTVRFCVPLVEPVRISDEERERQTATTIVLERGNRHLANCFNAFQITGLLIFIQTPFWTITLAFVASVYFYALAAAAGSQVTLLAGTSSEAALMLRHKAREWLTVLLLIAAVCVWYVPVVAPPQWPARQLLAGVALGSVLLAAAALAQWLLWRRDTVRYIAALDVSRRAREIEKRRVACVVSFGLWLLVVVLSILFGGWRPAVPPRTFTQWADTAAIALLAVWMLLNTVEYVLTIQWKRRFATTATESVDA